MTFNIHNKFNTLYTFLKFDSKAEEILFLSKPSAGSVHVDIYNFSCLFKTLLFEKMALSSCNGFCRFLLVFLIGQISCDNIIVGIFS